MDPVTFFVPGKPETKGSAKGFGFVRKHGPRAGSIGVNITNDNPRAKSWAALISSLAYEQMAGRAPWIGAVQVSLVFYLPRPQKHFFSSKKRMGQLRPDAPSFPDTLPDGDKMIRCAWDALTGVVLVDDKQIVEWPGGKRYAVDGRIGVQITVSPMVAGTGAQ